MAEADSPEIDPRKYEGYRDANYGPQRMTGHQSDAVEREAAKRAAERDRLLEKVLREAADREAAQ